MIPEKEPIQKILVVTLSNLGDVILTLPVFQALIKKYPTAELHTVVGPSSAHVFDGDERITKVFPFDKRMDFKRKWEPEEVVKRREHKEAGLYAQLKAVLMESLFGEQKKQVKAH
jgi:ADP-heptose:LPS heptosyltransferase